MFGAPYCPIHGTLKKKKKTLIFGWLLSFIIVYILIDKAVTFVFIIIIIFFPFTFSFSLQTQLAFPSMLIAEIDKMSR